MKFAIKIIPCLGLMAAALQAQPLPDYHTRSRFLFAPPASFEGGLAGFSNPANLALLAAPEFKFFWRNNGDSPFSIQDWGAFAGVKSLGFSAQRQKFGGVGVTDFRLSTAGGTQRLALGLSYGWSSGKFDASGREKLLSLGAIYRPSRFISAGFTGSQSVESRQREGVAELGVRPLGNSRLTLFADAALQKGRRLRDASWSLGGAAQLFRGVHLLARYFDSDRLTVGLTFSFGKSVVGTQAHFDSDLNRGGNTYLASFGGVRPSLFPEHALKEKYYVPMQLKGKVSYLKYEFLDDGGPRLLGILQNIQAAARDPRVRALALNLSGMRVRPEHAWEIREALLDARSAGKQVVIFIDRVGMTGYYLASVADKIVCDPQGNLTLQGYALGRTYFKGTLEKLGLGFDEWRFFKYKSASESFSRENMSEADREQLQAFVDDWYELTRSDVCEARSLSYQEFDRLIDERGFLLADEALTAGLVDTLARWSEVDKILGGASSLPVSEVMALARMEDDWGGRSKIAVVYGLGVCAMDSGIRARWLAGVFDRLARDEAVRAVVFRVDSPGGDGMASDVVAEAIKKCRERKPVIVSQGQVAASGGYWISANGSKIVAGPNTVTGSIGVIWGWVYDAGFGDKLGMTSDFVKRGAHADMGKGIRMPFLPFEVPARNVTPEERRRAEQIIRKEYDNFVRKVAMSRGLKETRVREIAEGRIYSGIDGRENGLVDAIGGLTTAIALARKEAGIPPEEKIELVEMPSNKGLFNFSKQLLPLGEMTRENQAMQAVRLLLKLNGTPLPALLPGQYPDYEK